jgi:hypothetical protein
MEVSRYLNFLILLPEDLRIRLSRGVLSTGRGTLLASVTVAFGQPSGSKYEPHLTRPTLGTASGLTSLEMALEQFHHDSKEDPLLVVVFDEVSSLLGEEGKLG